MSVVSVKARSFILALFIRDDGERFLLGDNGYDFKDSQLHFAANTIENDEVMKQGADGVMVAGQVRRASVQSFDGYVGDATMAKETIEQMRRDFFAFFVKGHHFRVVYIDCNRNAWQRKGGYLVDAPEVKELWQIHPEYHVGLNFEDVNYYSYDEDADGEEILSNLVDVPVSTAASGGLVWDEDGAVSEDAEVEYDTETAVATPARSVYITDATEAPLASFQLDGETSQNGTPTPSAPVAVQTVTGENVVKICGKNLYNNGLELENRYLDSSGNWATTAAYAYINQELVVAPSTDYSWSATSKTGSPNLRFCEYDSNGVFIKQTMISNISQTITTTTTTAIVKLSADKTASNSFEGPQLELGSTATDYEPYQGQSYPISLGSIELCKIGTYQDYIYKSGGKWYVRKETTTFILDGTKGDFYNSWFYIPFSGIGVTNVGGSDAPPAFSSQFKAYPYSTFVGNSSLNGMTQSSTNLLIRNTSCSNAATYKAWLGSTKPVFYYALATPTDTEITNEALIAQLEAVLGGHTYAGVNNIFTVTPNEQGTLEISYYTKYQPVVVSGGYVWEAGGAGGATIVVNNSIDNVNPIWKIYGPTMNPQLENSTTGETIEYVGLIAEGQTLTIDMGEQTASLDGLNVISNLVGDFISLAPGANRLIYSVSGDAGASEIGWSEIVG